jgi:phosphatidylglycerophosphatase A
MDTKNIPSLKKPEVLFLSAFGIGFIKYAPGTFGSLVVLPLLYLLGQFNPPFFIFVPFLLIFTFFSCYIAEITQKKYKLHDPGWIVIDEVIGMFVTWLFVRDNNLLHLLILFVLFRIFDIIKIWPASYFDKKVTHGAGTILDDVVSGIYAGIIGMLLIKYLSL